jgi:hypothetical protein
MDKFGSTRFSFSSALSVLLIVLLVGMLAGIIAAMAFGILPLQGKTGFVVPRVDTLKVQGQDVVAVQHKGGDTFLLNASPSSPPFSRIGFSIATDAGIQRVQVAPLLQKYSFAPSDTLYIYHAKSGYFLTDAASKIRSPVLFANGTYYLVITDETQKTLIMRLGPYLSRFPE